MQNDILNYFGRSHAQYLHAKGELGTNVLIQMLNSQPEEKILELGFGTGTTLVQLSSCNKKTKFYGVESSILMLNKAKARLRFCLLGDLVSLSFMKNKNHIPFESNSFDKIYLESVLAIQEGNNLQYLLEEIRRVLKPDGILIMNETLWLDSTNLDEIIHINKLSKNAFGIIQSNSEYPYLNNWTELLNKFNFECELTTILDDVKDEIKSEFRTLHKIASFTYTAIGKIRARLNQELRKENGLYKMNMKKINPENKPLMRGIIIKARKKKLLTL